MTVEDPVVDPAIEDPGVDPDAEPGRVDSAFRRQLSGDLINVFLDLEFFGELHHVDGKMIRVVLDEDVNQRADGAREYGISDTGFVMYCRETDLDRRLEGAQLEIDGRVYTVMDWRVDEGLSSVTLSRLAGF